MPMMTWPLARLLATLPSSKLVGNSICEPITGISLDSRIVQPGDLFVALPSRSGASPGISYIDQAIQNGTVAVLGPIDVGNMVDHLARPYIASSDVHGDLIRILREFYPQKPEVLVAITGTNGKTSVACFTQQLWSLLGLKSSTLGTLGVSAYPEIKTLTSPDPVTFHQLLGRLSEQHYNHVALEASSIGLEQGRLDGARFMAAGFTNFSHEHLDYHGTQENYFQAKTKLFQDLLPEGAVAVLNRDVPEFTRLFEICQNRKQQIISYGGQGADIALIDCQSLPSGQKMTIEFAGQSYTVLLPLIGRLQAINALCALGLVIGCGADINQAVQALSHLKSVPGRLELAAHLPNGARVYVDYAHSPHALESVLQALRPHCAGKLWLVFGCGGNRDAAKRPQMGQIAASLADGVFVTDDNPRHEPPHTIRQQILAACPEGIEIANRGQAISTALAKAGPGDVVLIAGKGHEREQIIGNDSFAFDDRAVVRKSFGYVGVSNKLNA